MSHHIVLDSPALASDDPCHQSFRKGSANTSRERILRNLEVEGRNTTKYQRLCTSCGHSLLRSEKENWCCGGGTKTHYPWRSQSAEMRKLMDTRGTAPQRRRALVYYRISSHPIPITHHVSRHSHRTAYHSPSPGATDVFTTVAILACSKHLARFPFCKCRRVLRETYELLWFSDRQRGSNRDRTRIHRDRTATAPD